MDDRITRRLIGVQEMLIAAGAEMSKVNEAEFTPLGQQAGGWCAELTRMIGEIEFHIDARTQLSQETDAEIHYGRGYQAAVQKTETN